MIVWTELLAFVTLGLVGSLHCAGMCGGFAIAVAAQSRSRALNLLAGQAHYILGKATTYAILGLCFATMGAWLTGQAGASDAPGELALSTTRSLLAWVAGLGLIVMGAFHIGIRPRWFHLAIRPKWARGTARVQHALIRPAASLLASIRGLPGWASSFGTGLLTGLLPCGLSWAALLLASRSTPSTALLGTFLFGLMTAPALLAVGLGSQWMTARWTRHASAILGVFLLVFGGITILRG